MIEVWQMIPETALRPLSILVIGLLLIRFSPAIVRALLRFVDAVFSGVDFIPSQLTQWVTSLVSPLRFFIAVIVLWLAFSSLGLSLQTGNLLNTIFLSLLVVILFWAAVRTLDLIFDFFQYRAKSSQDEDFNETLIQFGSRFTRAAVVLFGISTIIQFWGYELSGLVTGLGIGGLAVALAAQEALSNLIGYLAILTDKPFEVGDYIVADEFEGDVESIGFRTTRIRRPDRALIIVPNNALTNRNLTNWTLSNTGLRRGRSRIDLPLQLDPAANPEQIEAFIQAIRARLTTHPRAVPESITVNLVGFGEGYLKIQVVVVVNITGWSDLQDLQQDLSLYILRQVREHGLLLYEPK